MDASEVAFSEVMDPMRKVVASTSLDAVDWNAELIRGDVIEAVRALKDEYTFVVHPMVAGRGPRLLDGVDVKLELVERREFGSGATVQRYRPATLTL